MSVPALLAWFDAEGRDLPWRRSRDPYAVWVSETMLQQTRVERVLSYYERWMARWPDAAALAAAPLAEVLAAWQGLGYPRRARSLHAAARIVARDGWPRQLTDLPGVGPYTQAAIRCFAHEEPVLPPDVNVRRVLARRFPDGLDVAADPWRTGQALMELGQRVCTRRPRCAACPVAAGCPATGVEDPAPRRCAQARYEGSLRQRRGWMLRAVLAGEPHALDPEAAAGLVADGLLGLENGRLVPPVG